VTKGFVVLQRIEPGKAMLFRIVAMLTKLLERFDLEQFRVCESPSVCHSSTTPQSLRFGAPWPCVKNTKAWPRRRPCEVGTSTSTIRRKRKIFPVESSREKR
jgi:hypothetical protein